MNAKFMSRRQALRAVILATAGVGATAALAACGEEKVVEKIVTKTVEVEKVVVKEVPVEVLVPGGAEQQVLRFGASAEMGSLDNQADPNSEPSRAVIANILENLTRYGYKATSKRTRTKDHNSVVPWLAEGYEIADDAKTLSRIGFARE